MSRFVLRSEYAPTGDQPAAIEALVRGIREGRKHQVLLGVTGSGKTFTMAKVIEAVGKPTLVLAHNKTLAAQLLVEHFVFGGSRSPGEEAGQGMVLDVGPGLWLALLQFPGRSFRASSAKGKCRGGGSLRVRGNRRGSRVGWGICEVKLVTKGLLETDAWTKG